MEISINNVRKQYKGQTVLDVDNIKIPSGSITAITGSNGEGKSTLLNIIAGLIDDYEGEVLYDGYKLNQSIRKNMTLVFQKPYMMKQSVWQNLEYPLKLRKIDKKKRNILIEEMLEQFGIEDLKFKQANKLSGGEGQKVSIARAMIFSPQILLLDEPTSSIDKEFTEVIEKTIKQYNDKTNATVVMITHNDKQSDRICNNLIRLEKGRIEF